MFKVILIMEKKDYEDRPKTVIVDRLTDKSYVTFNFGIDQTVQGFSGYSSTVIFRDGEENAEGVLSQLVSTGMIGFASPSEFSELMESLPCEDRLKLAKDYQKERILAYDSSSSVNQFTLNDVPMWLDKATRAGLKLRLEAEQAAGKDETTLWYLTTPFNLPVSNAIVMLNRLEVYASDCYDNTQGHLARIADMDNVDELLNYDIEAGYPERLNF